MSLTLRSASNTFNDNERLTRKRQRTKLNRFLSFNENTSSSAENRRRSLQSTPNLIELLEEDEDDLQDNQASCHECNTCSKTFASEYGLIYHTNMHHPNQSILCSLCNITFRSHRSLKTHQQRRHSSNQIRLNLTNASLPNYNHISSYLFLAFTSRQFPLMVKIACEQERLPLGSLSSKLYQCQFCKIPFPCMRSLKYHLLNKHEQYEYKTCEQVLCDIIAQVEFNVRTVNTDSDDIDAIKLNLAQQASNFGLINKQLSKKLHYIESEQKQSIYPSCVHESRTCANLCLKHLSSYSRLIQNYPYTISVIPKGNPCGQGSIVSIAPSTNSAQSNASSSNNETIVTKDVTNGRQKRKSIKHADESSSPHSKKKVSSNTTPTNAKTNRNNSNNKTINNKQQNDHNNRANNETKSSSNDQSLLTTTNVSPIAGQRKILSKDNYIRSTSLSSTSSTSTRSSTIKSSTSAANSVQQISNSAQRSSKRSLSPTISIERSSQRRCRSREQCNKSTSSSKARVIKIDDDDEEKEEEEEEEEEEQEQEQEQDNGDQIEVEQENDEDESNGDDDVIPIKLEKPKQRRQNRQRQASTGSIEYVHTVSTDQQSTLSLNNIENIKSKSKVIDEEIVICRSPPSNKGYSKTSVNGAKKASNRSSSNNDEHVRVRCKVCGEILEGRSRFSKHVMANHSHLINKNSNESKQQQQIAIVR